MLDTKICNVLRQYLKDGDTSIRELPVHVVYYAISHVLKENNILPADKDLLIDHLRQVFPIDNCPIILVPLLHNTTIHRNRLQFRVSAMLIPWCRVVRAFLWFLQNVPQRCPELRADCTYTPFTWLRTTSFKFKAKKIP